MDDDDVDFFTRKPLPSKSKAKAKPKALAKSVNGIDHKPGQSSGTSNGQHPSSSATPTASTSTAVAAAQLIGDSDDDNDDDVVRDIDIVGKDDDDDDDDQDTLIYSSDVSTDDSDASSTKRRVKRRKKKHIKILPAWASQGVYRRPSQEPSSSSSSDVFHDAQSVLPGATASTDDKATANGGQGDKSAVNRKRERGVSLTPPPPPSPEKLSAARNLVTKVIGSKISTTSITAPTTAAAAAAASAPRRSTRNSATPGVGHDTDSASVMSPGSSRRGPGVIDDDDDDLDSISKINWDPDLARLMRGTNAKHIREQAKREQQERDAKRKQRELERIRQQPPSLPGSSQRQGQFSRTQSAPQPRSGVIRINDDGNDTDDSVEFVARPTKSTASPRRTRSSAAAGNAASQTQTNRNTTNHVAIVIDDSDDDAPNGVHSHISQTIDDQDDLDNAGTSGGAEQETLDLTLQSKLGPMQVTVTPTTKLLTIITHFHAKQNLADKVKPDKIKVMFDGFAFKPTQTVADMDVEDGDQVELSWPS